MSESASTAHGRLLVISGPSGVGKDTVIDEWRKINPRVKRVVAYTTRKPRGTEVNGIDYHFVTEDDFHRLIDEGAFLEYKKVHDNYYATPLKDLEVMLAEGSIAILKIDVQGALAVFPLRSDAVGVFLLPPSGEELERRIRSRGLDDLHAIERRLDNARAEMAVADKYHHRIVNESVPAVVEKLEALFG